MRGFHVESVSRKQNEVSDFFLDHFKSSDASEECVHRSCSKKNKKLLLLSASQPWDQPTNQNIAERVSGFISLEVWNLPDALPCLTAPPPQMKDVWRNDFLCGITCPGWAIGITVIELEIIFSHMHLQIAALICFFLFPPSSANKLPQLSAVRAVFFFGFFYSFFNIFTN